MEIIYVNKLRDVKRLKEELEKKVGVKIGFVGTKVSVDGDSVNEYVALQVFDAVNFGFSVRRALLLSQDDFVFRKVHIKEFTKRNLKDIKARLIGKYGKTRKTIAEISGCEVLVKDGEVGIIGYADDVDNTEVAIINLIKGSKTSNMYKYLERMNREEKKEFDLGLK